MSKASQARAVEVWSRLSRIHGRMSAALERDMMPHAGIPLGWYDVLCELKHAPGEMLRFQSVAREAGLSESGVSRRLEQMLKAGLIERISCRTDRRGVYAHITEAGTNVYEKAHAVFVRTVDEALANELEPQEAEAIRAGLARLGSD